MPGPKHLVQIRATDANEDGNPGEFTIVRTRPGGELTVNYEVTGTATGGADYQTLTGSVTFRPGRWPSRL